MGGISTNLKQIMSNEFKPEMFDDMFSKINDDEKPAVKATAISMLNNLPWRKSASFIESKEGIGFVMFALATSVRTTSVRKKRDGSGDYDFFEFITLVEAKAKLEAICG